MNVVSVGDIINNEQNSGAHAMYDFVGGTMVLLAKCISSNIAENMKSLASEITVMASKSLRASYLNVTVDRMMVLNANRHIKLPLLSMNDMNTMIQVKVVAQNEEQRWRLANGVDKPGFWMT